MLESTTYKFAKALKKKFPEEWEKLSGKSYITNSYHVVVTEEIDAFTKLKFESEFQELSPGGWDQNIPLSATLNCVKTGNHMESRAKPL